MAPKFFQILGKTSDEPRDRWIITVAFNSKEAQHKVEALENLLSEFKKALTLKDEAGTFEDKSKLSRATVTLFEKIIKEDPYWLSHGGQGRYEQNLESISYFISTGEMIRREDDNKNTRRDR